MKLYPAGTAKMRGLRWRRSCLVSGDEHGTLEAAGEGHEDQIDRGEHHLGSRAQQKRGGVIPIRWTTWPRRDASESIGKERFKVTREPPHELQEIMSKTGKTPTIARIWRGRTRRDRADDYERYNYEAGIKPLMAKALGVQALREDRADETEFITISYWESIEAMARFTGGDPTRIHHLPRDPEFLIELPQSVQIVRIRVAHGNTGGECDRIGSG